MLTLVYLRACFSLIFFIADTLSLNELELCLLSKKPHQWKFYVIISVDKYFKTDCRTFTKKRPNLKYPLMTCIAFSGNSHYAYTKFK